MAKVIFEDDELEIEVPDGTLLQTAIREAGANIPFGCREGECATCIVEIVEGAENLPDYNENEEITLLDEEREKGYRLACQLTVSGGLIRLRAADDLL